jgi:MFS family permease
LSPGLSSYLSHVSQFTPNAKKFLAYEFFLSLNAGIYGVIFNLYVLKLGYREDFLGLLLAIMFVTTGLFAIPAAMLCDHIGKKKTLLLSSLLLAGALAVLYTITSSSMLMAMSVIYGVASAFSVVAASPFLAENSTRDERMHLFSMNSVLYNFASIVGNLGGGVLPGILILTIGLDAVSVLPYRYTLYLSFVAVLLTLLPILAIKEKAPVRVDRMERLKLVVRVAMSRNVKRLVLVNCLIGIGAGMIVPFFNVYFHKVLSASPDQIGIIFSAGQVCMMLTLFAVPMLTEKFGKVRTIALTELLSIPFLVLIALTMNIYMAAFAYIMRMVLMNMANPAISSFNMEIVSEQERATVSSLTQGGWYLCLALSTFLSGILMAQSNYLLPYFITCLVYVAAAIMYYVFFLRIERENQMKPRTA